MLVCGSELTRLPALTASLPHEHRQATALGQGVRWQQSAQALGSGQISSIFSWSFLWEQSLQNQLLSWAYPCGHPSHSLALGS